MEYGQTAGLCFDGLTNDLRQPGTSAINTLFLVVLNRSGRRFEKSWRSRFGGYRYTSEERSDPVESSSGVGVLAFDVSFDFVDPQGTRSRVGTRGRQKRQGTLF